MVLSAVLYSGFIYSKDTFSWTNQTFHPWSAEGGITVTFWREKVSEAEALFPGKGEAKMNICKEGVKYAHGWGVITWTSALFRTKF